MRVFCRALPAVCLLLLVVLMAQVATTTTYYGSTDYNVDWNGNQMTGVIDFAVYDDRSLFESDFSYAGLSAPGDGDFVYAYRITQSGVSESPLAYFAILGLDEQDVSGFGALDDDIGGVQPSDYGFTEDDGYWQWAGLSHGLIQINESSWLLVYSSDYDWVKGYYEIKGAEGDFPVEGGGETPEPLTVALLGAGGAFLLRRRRKN